MDYKTQKIIELLNKNYSYTDIQAELGVSPSKISRIKKEFKKLITSTESSSNSGSGSNSGGSSILDNHDQTENHSQIEDFEQENRENEENQVEIISNEHSLETISDYKNIKEISDKVSLLVKELQLIKSHIGNSSLNTLLINPDFDHLFHILIIDLLYADFQIWHKKDIENILQRVVVVTSKLSTWANENKLDLEGVEQFRILESLKDSLNDLLMELVSDTTISSIQYSLENELRTRLIFFEIILNSTYPVFV
jgi:AraC-like DNA-binding protein